MKVALIQPLVVPGELRENLARVSALCRQALSQGAELLLLPENCLSGAWLGDLSDESLFYEECEACEKELLEIAGGTPLLFGNAFVLGDNPRELSDFPEPVPYVFGQAERRRKALASLAREHRLAVAYVASVSAGNAGKTWRAFDGRSSLFAASGALAAELPAFEECARVVDAGTAEAARPAPEGTDDLFRAIALQTRMVMRQGGIRRVVVGASGGIDSCVTAALMATVVDPDDLLLVNMPSRHNSATTKGIARALAENLGCRYAEVPVEPSVELTRSQLQGLPVPRLGGKGAAPDAAADRLELGPLHFENVQARDRGSRLLAAIAAAFGGVFTCNGNKAETTVGYATLYGDCSGFFAPIADLWKHQVYALGRHLNESVHGREIVPAAAFEIPPSAELGPDMDVEAGKGDPLVYPYHDFLFRWWTESEERPGPFASLSRFADGTLAARIGADPELVRRLFPDAASFVADLERWWRAFKGMGAVKRVQCPPLAAVSPWAFGSEREEAVLPLFFPSKYVELKNSLLRKR